MTRSQKYSLETCENETTSKTISEQHGIIQFSAVCASFKWFKWLILKNKP